MYIVIVIRAHVLYHFGTTPVTIVNQRRYLKICFKIPMKRVFFAAEEFIC